MTTLTKNRILQKGDEYLHSGGAWKPIPKEDFGLQIMFTAYSEVRRPTEAPKPISPDSGKSTKAAPVAKAESDTKSPAPSHSGAGDTRPPSLATTMAKAKTLPTVVSKKAHQVQTPEEVILPPQPEPVIHGISVKDAIKAKPHLPMPPPETMKVVPATITLDTAPYGEKPECEWIGRNGTFRQRALRMTSHTETGVIRFQPIGARGVGKNAKIEFPASIIPQVTDWLLRQQLTEKEKAKYA